MSAGILIGITDDDIAEKQLLIKYWWIFIPFYIVVQLIVIGLYIRKGKYENNASKNMHNFTHSIRNAIVENTSSKMICNSLEFKSKCDRLCQEICDFIKNEFNLNVTISIKLLKPWNKKQEEESVLQTEVSTLCITGADYKANETNIRKVVSEYTAFEDILLRRKNSSNKEKTTFACSNLTMIKIIWKIKDKEAYKGCSEESKSTVVVPIRVHKDYIDIDSQECYKGYKTYGFLCVECKKTCSEITMNKLADFVCAFTDCLCAFFANAYMADFYDKYSNTTMLTS